MFVFPCRNTCMPYANRRLRPISIFRPGKPGSPYHHHISTINYLHVRVLVSTSFWEGVFLWLTFSVVFDPGHVVSSICSSAPMREDCNKFVIPCWTLLVMSIVVLYDSFSVVADFLGKFIIIKDTPQLCDYLVPWMVLSCCGKWLLQRLVTKLNQIKLQWKSNFLNCNKTRMIRVHMMCACSYADILALPLVFWPWPFRLVSKKIL